MKFGAALIQIDSNNPGDYVIYCKQSCMLRLVRFFFFYYYPDDSVSVCACVRVCVCTLDIKGYSYPPFLSRWAGSKARQKMRRGWWLIRWLVTGMAILSLMTHSWGQDTEGRNSQHFGEPPQASKCSFNSSCTAKMKLELCGKRWCFTIGKADWFKKKKKKSPKKNQHKTNNKKHTTWQTRCCAKMIAWAVLQTLLNGPAVKIRNDFLKVFIYKEWFYILFLFV